MTAIPRTVLTGVHGFDISTLQRASFDNHIERRLSSMRGQYADSESFGRMLGNDDVVVYEVYEVRSPEVAGELSSGFSIVHPGTVGSEYFMTKGHFHSVLETAEVYWCVSGQGMMVMETPEGSSEAVALAPGSLLYVPPRWAHRSVNTGSSEDLVTFFCYPSNAGHDYGTIESTGFRKLIQRGASGPVVVDNPRWKR